MTLAADMLSDLSTFFSSEWGDSALPNGGAVIYGHFNNAYQEFNAEVPIGDKRPAFLCKWSDVSSLVRDNTFVVTSVIHAVSSVTYYVVNVQRDPDEGGPGTAMVILRKAG